MDAAIQHNNRQAEPYLVGDTILNVEVANKEAGALMQKWVAPGVLAKKSKCPTALIRTGTFAYTTWGKG